MAAASLASRICYRIPEQTCAFAAAAAKVLGFRLRTQDASVCHANRGKWRGPVSPQSRHTPAHALPINLVVFRQQKLTVSSGDSEPHAVTYSLSSHAEHAQVTSSRTRRRRRTYAYFMYLSTSKSRPINRGGPTHAENTSRMKTRVSRGGSEPLGENIAPHNMPSTLAQARARPATAAVAVAPRSSRASRFARLVCAAAANGVRHSSVRPAVAAASLVWRCYCRDHNFRARKRKLECGPPPPPKPRASSLLKSTKSRRPATGTASSPPRA